MNKKHPEFAQRLINAMQAKGITRVELAKETNINYEMIRRYEEGLSKPREKGIKALANVLGITSTYLSFGEGEPIAKNEISNFRPISEWDEDTPLDSDEVEIPYYKNLAFACGHGNDNLITDDDEKRKLRMSRLTLQRLGIYQDQTFSATADGDSMSPTINDGNTIFVDKGRTKIKDGKIFAISHGGLHTCKRLYNLPNGGVRIVSDNKAEYKEIELSKKQIEEQEFVIIGWVYHWSNTERW